MELLRGFLILILFKYIHAWRVNFPGTVPTVPQKHKQRPFYDYKEDYESPYRQEFTLPALPRRITPRPQLTTGWPFPTVPRSVTPPTMFFNHGFTQPSHTFKIPESPTTLLTRLEFDLISDKNVNSPQFRRKLAGKLSNVLAALSSNRDLTEEIPIIPVQNEFIAKVTVFNSGKVRFTNRVYCDFLFMWNSTYLDGNVLSQKLTEDFSREELTRLIGYEVAGLPKVIRFENLDFNIGASVDTFLRFEMSNFHESKGAFYDAVDEWLANYVVPYTLNASDIQANGDISAMITRQVVDGNQTIIDFLIVHDQRFESIDLIQLAKNSFVLLPLGLQQHIDFTILSAGFVVYNNSHGENYTKLFERSDDYVSPLFTSENFHDIRKQKDVVTRFLTIKSFDEPVEETIQQWLMENALPVVKDSLNTTLNATVTNVTRNFGSTTVDFLVVFNLKSLLVAAKSSDVAEAVFNNIDVVSKGQIISGGYFGANNSFVQSSLAKTQNKNTSERTSIATRPTTNPEITTHRPLSTWTTTNNGSQDLFTSYTSATAIDELAWRTQTNKAELSRSPINVKIAHTVGQTPTTQTEKGLNKSSIEENRQITRIVFQVPVELSRSSDQVLLRTQNWLTDHVAPLIQQTFGINNASALITNFSSDGKLATADFSIYFLGDENKMANASGVASDLFATSLSKLLETTPFPVETGGYLVHSNETEVEFRPVYSASEQISHSTLASIEYLPKQLLQIDLKVPTVIDIRSESFKQLIARRLKNIIITALKSAATSDNLYVDAARFSNIPNIYEVVVVKTGRYDRDDEEITAIQFAIIFNSTILNAALAANSLGLNVPQEDWQNRVGFNVAQLPRAVTSIKKEKEPEPESKLWIIAAVLVPLIILIILINICIMCCCRPPSKDFQQQHFQNNQMGLPPVQPPGQQCAPPFMQPQPYPVYIYPPYNQIQSLQSKEKEKQKEIDPQTARNNIAFHHDNASSSPPKTPPKVTYQLMSRKGRSVKKQRRRIRPMASEQNPEIVSQVASSLLKEALRSMTSDEHASATEHSHSPLPNRSVHVADQNCQTDVPTGDGSEPKAWTREYEQSLLRLASLVVSPHDAKLAREPGILLNPSIISLPEHGARVAEVHRNMANMAIPSDPKKPPALENAERKDVMNGSGTEGEYLDMNESQVQQLERLNALFMNIPKIEEEIKPSAPITMKNIGQIAKPADEYDVIVDSLKPGIPPRKLLEAIRSELENYGKPQK